MIQPTLFLFVAGAVCSEVINVTKRDGETVTLHINTIMHPNHDYLWSIDPNIPITIVINGDVTHVNGTGFEKRVHTHVATGSITISNLTINDSGTFLAQVLTKTGILEQRFNLSVHDNSLIPLNVLRGDNITLDPGVEKLQKEHNVMWTHGPDFSGILIAQWKNFSTFIEESFEGVLQLNQQTGSLTLLRVTENYAGYYCVKMLLGTEPHILRKYLITVFGPVSTPHISRAQISTRPTHSLNDVNCYIHCSVESGPGVTLSWYRGEKKINQTSSSDLSTNLTLPLTIQDQDEGNYSCVAANLVSKEAVTLNSTLWCPPHDRVPMWVIISTSVVGVVAVAVVLMFVVKSCKRKQNGEECFGMVNRTAATPSQSTEVFEDSEENVEQKLLTAGDQHQNE